MLPESLHIDEAVFYKFSWPSCLCNEAECDRVDIVFRMCLKCSLTMVLMKCAGYSG